MDSDPRTTLRSGLPDRYLTPEDLASLFAVPVETVYGWRKKGTGPTGFRVGRHVRYDPRAVAAWIGQQTDDPRTTLRSGLPDRYLTPEDLASLFAVPVETVYGWRKKGTGPTGFRVGRHVRYDPRAVAAWIGQQTDAEAA